MRFYVGFDPTAPSLHMGNLVQLLTAKRLQLAGHTPYALVGGATGMIGDPRDSGERTLNSLDTVKEWVEKVHRQIEPFLDFEGHNAATMVNNYDWTASLSTIDFLRDIGKHFPVNRMLARDVVRSRLEAGISYTEFSYILLQSMDFLNLYRDHGVRLQFGGSDQWGNLTGGVELIRRVRRRQGPRLRDAAGHQGRRHQVRQDRGRRPVARPGDDVAVRLPPVLAQRRGREGRRAAAHLHLPLPRGDRGARGRRRAEKPSCGPAQKALADAVTTEVHGAEETEHAKAAAAALFGGGDLRELRGRDARRRAARGRGHPRRKGHRCGRPARGDRAWSRARARRAAPSPRAAPT